MTDKDKARYCLELWDKAMRDPYTFLTKFVWTFNPHDIGYRSKFPDKEYLKEVCKIWQEENRILIVKSRQIMLSWTTISLVLWECIRKPNQIAFLQTKKLSDAASAHIPSSLLNRILYIVKNLPSFARISHNIVWSPNAVLTLGNNSTIQGVSSDSEAIRSSVGNVVLIDEGCSFENELNSILASVIPAIGSNGKLVIVSTVKPGTDFIKLIFDK